MRLANQDWDLYLMEGIAAISFMTYFYELTNLLVSFFSMQLIIVYTLILFQPFFLYFNIMHTLSINKTTEK